MSLIFSCTYLTILHLIFDRKIVTVLDHLDDIWQYIKHMSCIKSTDTTHYKL